MIPPRLARKKEIRVPTFWGWALIVPTIGGNAEFAAAPGIVRALGVRLHAKYLFVYLVVFAVRQARVGLFTLDYPYPSMSGIWN